MGYLKVSTIDQSDILVGKQVWEFEPLPLRLKVNDVSMFSSKQNCVCGYNASKW